MSVTLNGVLQTISAMERYFRGGFGWGKVLLHNPLNGRKCLVGAVRSVRASDGNSSWVPSAEIEAAKHYIGLAVLEQGGDGGGGDWTIMHYNDVQRSYHAIAAVMARAKQLAVTAFYAQHPHAVAPQPVRALPAPASVPQVLPPVRPALPAPAPVVPVVIDAEWEPVRALPTPAPVVPVVIDARKREPVPVREARAAVERAAVEQVTRELEAICGSRAVWHD